MVAGKFQGLFGRFSKKTSLQTSIYSISSCDRGLLLYLAGKLAYLFTSSSFNDELKADAVGDRWADVPLLIALNVGEISGVFTCDEGPARDMEKIAPF